MLSPQWQRLALPVVGCLSAAGYALATAAIGFSSAAMAAMIALFVALGLLWGAALWVASMRVPSPRTVVAFAVLFRVLLLPAGADVLQGEFTRFLLFDDGVWRYLWEGHAWSAGVDPTATPPSALDDLTAGADFQDRIRAVHTSPRWGTVFENIGDPHRASAYPIGAHALFRTAHWLAPGSVLAWKALMLAFDLAVVCLLARTTRRAGTILPLLAYAWNPLVIKEFAGSAHVDAAMVALSTLALASPPVVGSVALAAAGLVNPVAWVLVPALVRRGGVTALVAPVGAAALLVAFFPTGLTALLAESTFNPVLLRIFPLPTAVVVALGVLALGVVAAYGVIHDDGSPRALARQAVWLLGTALLVSPILEPWYLTWVVPCAALAWSPFWLAFSVSAFIGYHAHLDLVERPLLVGLELVPPLVAWWWWTRRSSSAGERLSPLSARTMVSLASRSAALGGLCCLAPIVLVMFGLSSVSFAASLGNLLYGEYRWAFRLISALLAAAGLVAFFRTRGVCTLDDAARHRTFVVDAVMLTLFASATAYLLLTYVTLQELGIRMGLPWAQYDETWAPPVVLGTLLVTAGLYYLTRGPQRTHDRD